MKVQNQSVLTHITKELGIKVIVLEKPLANTINQAKELIKLVKKYNAKILVNHRRRYDEEVIKLKKKIDTDLIGDILQVSSFYVYGILTTGTHLIDTLRMLLRDKLGEVDKVIGVLNKLNNFKPKDDTNIDGFLFFKKNVIASIQSLDMKSYDNFDIIIYGRKGKIEITDIGRKILKYRIIKSPEHVGFTELDRKPTLLCSPKPRNQFGYLAKNAVKCLKNKKILPLSKVSTRRRQDRQPYIYENSLFYFIKTSIFLKSKKIYSKKWNYFLTDKYESIDINDKIDFNICNKLY